MRMEDDRQVKAAVLGWMEDLERYEKVLGKKRKTVLYWKKLVREAGLDYTRIGMLTKDRKEWRAKVNERMRHLHLWERCAGKKNNETRPERNVTNQVGEDDLTCEWENCGRVFKSKGGLTIHRKRVHEISKQKVKFTCTRCEEEFSQEANLWNHEEICTWVKGLSPRL